MISLKCLEDCNAEIIVISNNQPIKCFNCNRVWEPTREGGFRITSGPGLTIYSPLPEKRREV